MHERKSVAGGFFLMAAILIGFGVGAAMGEPTRGAIAGTLAGGLAAVLVWLLDRRRSGR